MEIEVSRLHALGLGNREIARTVGIEHWKVARILLKLGLPTNNPRGKPPISVSDNEAICSSCKKTVLKSDFALLRSHSDGRRLSKCRLCRKKQMQGNLTKSPTAFCSDRQGKLRRRCEKARIPYNLPDGYILDLLVKQGGLCFYSDDKLRLISGEGYSSLSLSVDRVVFDRGYVKGNVVLCGNRVNSIKRDMTLDEMKRWTPEWHRRILEWQGETT